MLDDVKLAVEGRVPVHFYGRCGGMIPEPEELTARALDILSGDSQ